jgi:hypothetical protein
MNSVKNINTSADKTHLSEGLNIERWQSAKVENFLTDLYQRWMNNFLRFQKREREIKLQGTDPWTRELKDLV